MRHLLFNYMKYIEKKNVPEDIRELFTYLLLYEISVSDHNKYNQGKVSVHTRRETFLLIFFFFLPDAYLFIRMTTKGNYKACFTYYAHYYLNTHKWNKCQILFRIIRKEMYFFFFFWRNWKFHKYVDVKSWFTF